MEEAGRARALFRDQEDLSYCQLHRRGDGKGISDAQVIDDLGGPRLIARTIVDATLDTEDRPDGFQSHGGARSIAGPGPEQQGRAGSGRGGARRSVHYVDFSKWYVRLITRADCVRGCSLLITLVFMLILGLAGWVIRHLACASGAASDSADEGGPRVARPVEACR